MRGNSYLSTITLGISDPWEKCCDGVLQTTHIPRVGLRKKPQGGYFTSKLRPLPADPCFFTRYLPRGTMSICWVWCRGKLMFPFRYVTWYTIPGSLPPYISQPGNLPVIYQVIYLQKTFWQPYTRRYIKECHATSLITWWLAGEAEAQYQRCNTQKYFFTVTGSLWHLHHFRKDEPIIVNSMITTSMHRPFVSANHQH